MVLKDTILEVQLAEINEHIHIRNKWANSFKKIELQTHEVDQN